MSGTVGELHAAVLKALPEFLHDCHIKRVQAACAETDKADVKTDDNKAVLQVDFAENFSTFFQDEIQAAHWRKEQFTLFTCVLWQGSNCRSAIVLSDNLDHDKFSIVPFLYVVINELVEHPSSVSLKIWSDNPSSQFKNRFIGHALHFLGNLLKCAPTWNFFAPKHGKGPCDGIGAVNKRHVSSGIIRRQWVINNIDDYAAASQGTGVRIISMKQRHLEDFNDQHNLRALFENAPPLAGISKAHCLIPDDDDHTTRLQKYSRSASSAQS